MNRLLITVLALVSSLYVSLPAKEVTGSVKCGREKLEGVIVTDGTGFAVTGKNGKFSLDIADSADFVYVITPAGYAAPFDSGSPVFYKEAEGNDRFDFRLVATSSSRDYTIIAIADPQTLDKGHFRKFSETGLPDLYSTVDQYRDGQTVGVTLGDICWDSMDMFPLYKEAMAATGIPFYPVIGNHDHQKDLQGDIRSGYDYRKVFGPENYAFGIGDDYVVVLDNIIYDTQKKYEEGYAGHVLEWVEALLEYIPEDANLLIAQHSPAYFWKQDQYVRNADRLIKILEGRKVTFMSGHTHINNNLDIAPGMTECNIAAICGTWWTTRHCNDGTPAGYKVFEKRDGRLTWYYKSVGYDKDFQMEIFRPGQSSMHPEGVVANIWDYDPSWTVEWLQDGKPMGAMKQVQDCSPEFIRELDAVYRDKGKKAPGYKSPYPNTHYFLAVPDKGARKVTVIVRSGDGREWEYDVE